MGKLTKVRNFILGAIILHILFAMHTVAGKTPFIEVEEKQFEASPEKPFEVLLDVDVGVVTVEKGSDAHSGKLFIEYTMEKFRFRVDFNERKNRLRISLDKRDWRKWPKKGMDDRDHLCVMQLQLPYGVDIYFDSRVKAGEITMKMGGLRLKEFTFSNWAGESEVRFDEPNPVSMDFLDIDVKVGEARLVQLGNARFSRADINGGIGDIDIDFTGDLLSESRAKVDLDIGEASILLPQDVAIRMRIGGGLGFLSQKNIDSFFYRRGKFYYSEDYEEQRKKIFLRITPGLGELNIDRE